MNFMSLLLITVVLLCSTCTVALAETHIVYDTKLYVYAQSRADSDAHLIRSSVGIYEGGEHSSCGNRAYINFENKELFAFALAASLSGKSVHFMYEDAAPSKTIAGHVISQCKVLSIWQ